uniref:Uncharacterized protein n=1 Tax=Sphaerodactylus townsendi TaxID=933632 RepID=A0ACB8F7W6_9SAUR
MPHLKNVLASTTHLWLVLKDIGMILCVPHSCFYHASGPFKHLVRNCASFAFLLKLPSLGINLQWLELRNRRGAGRGFRYSTLGFSIQGTVLYPNYLSSTKM